ncbi:undecaprenyldiphospho-muramoylpentapeptide beta-N-acetylglucosaminyltransferase [Patescibacteria group bacterium]
MKILFTGGGTGGHFYPIIAIAEEINELASKEHLLETQMYFVAPNPYDKKELFEHGIEFKQAPAGKVRKHFSIKNFFDIFKTATGIIKATWQLYRIFPDVVFGKGGYGSFPTLFAARFLGIPVIIHESDSKPGKVNKWAGKFAKRIAVSYPDAAQYFPEDRVALTGNPIRKNISIPQTSGAHEFLKLEKQTPVILILGGSQGAQRINEAILGVLPELVKKYQVIHQTGKEHFKEISGTASVILQDSPNKNRYKPFEYLNDLAMKMSAGISDVVISRAGSSIFEIATWGLPSIIIPIPEEISHDQRSNAFTYARSGACLVVEEKNLSPHVLMSSIDRLMDDENTREEMKQAAKEFARPDAGEKIAREILNLALKHEK